MCRPPYSHDTPSLYTVHTPHHVTVPQTVRNVPNQLMDVSHFTGNFTAPAFDGRDNVGYNCKTKTKIPE